MIAIALLLAQSAATPDVIAKGDKIFAASCSVGYCHGAAGSAGRGPRLRGRSFSHDYLVRVTRDGIPKSAMPGWKDRLKDDEILAVVAYVESLANASEQAPPANPMPPGVGPAQVAEFKGPAAAGQGLTAFFDAVRDIRCGSCHAIGGRGIAIGPDVAAAAKWTPAELRAAVRATRPKHVLTATLKDGETFAALRAGQEGGTVRLYDITSGEPVLRSFAKADIVSLTEDRSWSHANAAKRYSDAELDDVAAYLRWAVNGQ